MAHRCCPSSRCSESAAAAAALGHLQDVEKQLQSKGLPFNKETVQHLEDAVKAIKKLEEERKHTIDLLEEETIKNSNLRIRVKGYPAKVMKEFEELVAAAHRFRFLKLSEVETSINESVGALKQACMKQQLCEEQNESLCVEQGEAWTTYTEIVQQVNQQLGEKHAVNIQINEFHNMKKQEEDDTVSEKIAIEKLKKLMDSETIKFNKKKTSLELQIAELRRQLMMKKSNFAAKEQEYKDLQSILSNLLEKVAKYNQDITDMRGELQKMFDTIKELITKFETKKVEKEELAQKRQHLEEHMLTLDQGFDNERQSLLWQLKETEEQLETLQQIYQKLKDENDILEEQYKKLLSEENCYCGERDQLAAELDRLSNKLTERLDYVAKRVIETRTIEEELDKIMNVYEEAYGSCAREMTVLEDSLKKESNKRGKLQDQFNEITATYQNLTSTHEEFVNTSQEEVIAAKNHYNDLKEKNEYLTTEIKIAREKCNSLSSRLLIKEQEYEKFVDDLTTEIKNLEDECDTKTKMIEEIELKLQEDTPRLENLQQELAEARTNYANQCELFQALREEEYTLKKNIEFSAKEVVRLDRLKVAIKNDLMKQRAKVLNQLKTFLYSLKFIERDNYELGRMIFILNAENERLRAGIAYLREDISILDSEVTVYQSKRQKVQKDKTILYEHFDKEWKKDDLLLQMFVKYQHEIWIILEKYIRRYQKRNDKVDRIYEALHLNYEEMEFLIESKSNTEADKRFDNAKAGSLNSPSGATGETNAIAKISKRRIH